MSYRDDLQKIANQYFEAGADGPATAREIAAWAIDRGLWEPQRAHVIDQCAREIAHAMREEYIRDPQGRRVRRKHTARLEVEGKQQNLWDDYQKAPREFMEIAFQQRRNHIVSECRQLKTDVDSYNDNVSPLCPIQMIFDFTDDLEEADAAAA